MNLQENKQRFRMHCLYSTFDRLVGNDSQYKSIKGTNKHYKTSIIFGIIWRHSTVCSMLWMIRNILKPKIAKILTNNFRIFQYQNENAPELSWKPTFISARSRIRNNTEYTILNIDARIPKVGAVLSQNQSDDSWNCIQLWFWSITEA